MGFAALGSLVYLPDLLGAGSQYGQYIGIVVLSVIAAILFSKFSSQGHKTVVDKRLATLSTALDNSPVSVIITNTKGRVEYLNKTFLDSTGFNQEDLIGVKPKEFRVKRLVANNFYKELWETILSGETWKGELLNKKANGEEYWLQTSISSIKENDKITHFIAVGVDITQLKAGEEQLEQALYETSLAKQEVDITNENLEEAICNAEDKANEAQMVSLELQKVNLLQNIILENSLAGISLIRNDKMETLNPKWLEMLGYNERDLINKSINVLFKTQEEYQDILTKVRYAFFQGETFSVDCELCRKDGSLFWSHICCKALNSPETNGGVWIIYDITERKIFEKELHEARKTAESATKAKSEFLANMSHEIRTPMNSILGFSEILKDSITSPHEKKYLNAIHSSGKSLLRLINDILDLSKVEAGKFSLEYTPVNTHDIFNDMIQIFDQKIKEKNLDFIVDIDKDLPNSLLLDEMRLRQILLNLVGNAIKFTERGYIKLSVRKKISKKDTSSLEFIFSVEDTGIGVPDSQKDKIFGAFEQQEGQSNASYGGTGLGLAITERLIKMMNGEIFITDGESGGAIFNVVLRDVNIPATKTSTTKSIDYENILFQDAKILIADDITLNRTLLKNYLAYPTFSFTECKNGQEVLDALENEIPDILFLDVKMPIMTGDKVAKIMKADERLKDIPIVIITASAMLETERELKALCNEYLTKPVSKNEIFEVLMKYVKHQELETKKDDLILEVNNIDNSELLELLTEKLDNWEKISDLFIINEIEDWTREVYDLAKLHKSQTIEKWAQEVLDNVEMFEMDLLKKNFAKFKNLIEKS